MSLRSLMSSAPGPAREPDKRLERRLLFYGNAAAAVVQLTFTAIYLALGLPAVAGVVVLFTAGFAGNALCIRLTQRTRAVFRSSMTIALTSVGVGMWLLGGYAPALIIGVWGLIVPLLAASFLGLREAMAWLVAYVVLLGVGAFVDGPSLPQLASLPEWAGPAFFFGNTVGVSIFAFAVFTYLVRRRREAMEDLAREHDRSEALLLNILPPTIADRLKRTPGTIADRFDNVTILFADIVGFTTLSTLVTPERLVALLDDIFSEFDALAERHGLEKIKTIGDAYMVVGGLPEQKEDHASAVAEMALEMMEVIHRRARDIGHVLDVRIGIHTGPVVAGVIGRKKFSYDLWGDAVNTASRMESHGIPGSIQVSETSYRLMKDGRFTLEPRGAIPVKGKGEMQTWLLRGPR